MIETRDMRTAREKAEYGEREKRAVAYAAKMGVPPGYQEKTAVTYIGPEGVERFKSGMGETKVKSTYKDPEKRKEYRREWMRKKRAAK